MKISLSRQVIPTLANIEELIQVTLMIYNKDNTDQTFMDPTPRLPPTPFINKYSKKYYNVCQQQFNLSISNNGEVTCLNRKRETQLTNTQKNITMYANNSLTFRSLTTEK